MRMVVVKDNDKISCLPVSNSQEYYSKHYEVLTYVNKLWNPYHVNKIKKYYSNTKKV